MAYQAEDIKNALTSTLLFIENNLTNLNNSLLLINRWETNMRKNEPVKKINPFIITKKPKATPKKALFTCKKVKKNSQTKDCTESTESEAKPTSKGHLEMKPVDNALQSVYKILNGVRPVEEYFRKNIIIINDEVNGWHFTPKLS